MAVTAVSTDRWKGGGGGDKSLGLPGDYDPLLHGVVGDRKRLGFGSKSDLEIVDGEENSPGASEMT